MQTDLMRHKGILMIFLLSDVFVNVVLVGGCLHFVTMVFRQAATSR